MNKRMIFALAAGILAVGAVSAAAASLGGVTGASLGADTTVVASCDTDGIGVGYSTAYSSTTGTYQVTGVNLTGVNAACNSRAYAVTLADAANASLVQGTGNLTVTTGNASIAVTPVSATAVVRLSIVISG